ncbi:hypothetical protein D3C73_1656440 [compost metagenome]
MALPSDRGPSLRQDVAQGFLKVNQFIPMQGYFLFLLKYRRIVYNALIIKVLMKLRREFYVKGYGRIIE